MSQEIKSREIPALLKRKIGNKPLIDVVNTWVSGPRKDRHQAEESLTRFLKISGVDSKKLMNAIALVTKPV